MTDDQLTRRERLRLEALSQALTMSAIIPPAVSTAQGAGGGIMAIHAAETAILLRAEKIEKWLIAADHGALAA